MSVNYNYDCVCIGVNRCDIVSEYECCSSETTESEDSDYAHEVTVYCI